jgi:hypothetical protein
MKDIKSTNNILTSNNKKYKKNRTKGTVLTELQGVVLNNYHLLSKMLCVYLLMKILHMVLHSQMQSQTHTFTYTLKTYGSSDLCCNNPINSWPHISIYIFHCTGSHTYLKSYIVQVVTHINLYLS